MQLAFRQLPACLKNNEALYKLEQDYVASLSAISQNFVVTEINERWMVFDQRIILD